MVQVIIAAFVCGFTAVTNAQSLWRQIAQPTTRALLDISFADRLHGWAVGVEGTIVRTTDGGGTWTQQYSGVSTAIDRVFMVNARMGWAITLVPFVDTLTFYGTRIIRTTNGGATWSKEDFPIVGQYFHTVLFHDTLHGWLGGERGSLFQTTSGGSQWKRAVAESSSCAFYPILNVQFFSPDFGFAMGGTFDFAGMIWKTTNAGVKWTAQCACPEPVWGMHAIDSVNIVGLVGDFDIGSSMIRSSDGGNTWEYTNLGIFGLPRSLSFRTPYEGWVPTGNRFLVTHDTARTWVIGDTLVGRQAIYDAVFTDSLTGFAVTDSGMIFKYDRETTDVKDITRLPSETQLLPGYPNPFNPATTIGYRIASTGLITIKVLDILGREVSTLANEVQTPGYHEVVWKPEGISSGLYFCVMHCGSYTGMQRLTLLK